MPAITKKATYIAKSLKELNKKIPVQNLDQQLRTIESIKKLIDSNDKVYKEAETSYDKGDEERAYILYMRYVETDTAIKGSRPFKTGPPTEVEFVRKLMSPLKLKKSIERAEELSKSLKERYDLEEAKQIASKLSSVPNGIKTSPVVNGTIDNKENTIDHDQEKDELCGDPSKCKTVTSMNLYAMMMGNESKLTTGSYISSIFNEMFMVIDCRQQADYIESRIRPPQKCATSGHVIILNVPEEYLKPGTVMRHIEDKLNPDMRNQIKKRRNAHKVILMDSNSTEIKPGSPIAALFDALWKWDNSPDRIKQPPVLLKGGFEDWLHRYPQFTTNSSKLRTPSPSSDLYSPKERIIPIQLEYDPNEDKSQIKTRADSPIPSSPELRSFPDNRRSSSRTSSLSSSSTASQQEPKITNIFINGVGANSASRPVNGVFDPSNPNIEPQSTRFGSLPSKSATGQVNELRNRFETSMVNRDPSLAPGGAKPAIDRGTKPSIGPQLPTNPPHVSQNNKTNEIGLRNGSSINHGVAFSSSPANSASSSYSSSLPSSSTLNNHINAVSAQQSRLKTREGDSTLSKNSPVTHLDDGQIREFELQRLRQTKPVGKITSSEHHGDTNMGQRDSLRDDGKSTASFRSVSPTKAGGPRSQLTGPSMSGRGDDDQEDEEQDVHSSSKSASSASSTLSTGGDEASGSYIAQLRQSSPVPRRQHLHSESSSYTPNSTITAAGLKHQYSENTPSAGMLSARRSSLSRSHSSPNIAKLVADEMEASQQSRVMKSRSTVGGPPQFDRALKPINQISSAKIRNFNPVYGTGESITGLRNLGNTCFMNAVIQCFVYTRELAEYFATESYVQDINRRSKFGSRGELTDELAALIKSMCTGQYKSLSPRDFKEKVDSHLPAFTGCDQQDSHEFLIMLLEKLHWDLNVITTPPQEIKDIPIPDDLAPHLALNRFWNNHTAKNQSMISKLFEGLLMSSLRCLTCTKMSTSFEVFSCLSLPIPVGSNRCTLEECFKHFSRPERLDGAWECPNCKTKRDAEKKIVICRLPKVLLIHLKRFSYDGMWRQKLQTFVDFPLQNLNLKPYIYHNQIDNINGPTNANAGRTNYDLYGVVNHYGTLEGGHYTSYCRVGCDFERPALTMNGKKPRNWVKFDDHEVTDISPVDVKTQGAYILFYTMT